MKERGTYLWEMEFEDALDKLLILTPTHDIRHAIGKAIQFKQSVGQTVKVEKATFMGTIDA